MRILLIPLAGGVGLGPLTRCLAVASEARQRGHDVALLCKKSFLKIAAQYGYKTFPAPSPKLSRITTYPFRLSDVAAKFGWLEESYIESAVREEQKVIRIFNPNVIFTETQFSVPISATVAGIPWAATASWADHPDFKSPLYEDKHTVRGFEHIFNRILTRYGLPEINDINELAYMRANAKIAPTIPELQPELRKVPDVHFIGYLLSPEFEAGRLPSFFDRWGTRNPIIYVYMSPGDIPPRQWIRTMIKTFEHTHFNVVVILAPLNILPLSLPSIPNIQFVTNAPGSAAISRSRIVITHGGGNTVSNALLHGKPLVIFPHLYAERDYNGRAVENLGAGINLRTEQFTARDIMSYVRQILSDKTFAQNAQIIGKRMKMLGGSRRALDVLEKLVGVP